MRLLAITGAMASGKSTLGTLLSHRGYPLCDVDEIVPELLQPGSPLVGEVARVFGDHVVAADGTLDVARLRAHALADLRRLRHLHDLVLPSFLERIGSWRDDLERRGATLAFVLYPFVAEKGIARHFDGVISVTCPRNILRERLRQRGVGSDELAESLLSLHASDDEKACGALFVIDGSGDEARLAEQVDALIDAIEP